MGVYKISSGTIKNGKTNFSSMLAGNATYDPTPYIQYLVIGGGGGGGSTTSGSQYVGGGGGAGGYRTSFASETSGGGSATEPVFEATLGTAYYASVGAGGSAGNQTQGYMGTPSRFGNVLSHGGGQGGGNAQFGSQGGSEGGSGGANLNSFNPMPGEGYAAGTAVNNGTSSSAAGGGGAGGVGGSGSGQNGGAGGIGLASLITGTSVQRAGGGGGSRAYAGGTNGIGSYGGGTAEAGPNGTANTGGGGAGYQGGNLGGVGGSGVIILRYNAAYTCTVSAGLTSSTSTLGSEKITTLTAGTGTVTWS